MASNFKMRRLKNKDWKDVFEYGSDPETTKFLRWGPYKEEQEAKDWIKLNKKSSNQIFAIVVHGKMIGTISFMNITDKKIEIGFVINKDYREMGVGTKALTRMLNFSYRWHKGKEVYAIVNKNNAPSQGLLEKCGFEKKRETTKGIYYSFKN